MWQGGRGACMAGGMHDRGHAWQGGCAWQGGVHGMHTPRQILWLWHTVNEWVVRILLECNLVRIIFFSESRKSSR